MKQRYRIFRRENGIYYSLDTLAKKRNSLNTTDREEAKRFLNALNEACQQPAVNLQIAQVYLQHSDPDLAKRIGENLRLGHFAGFDLFIRSGVNDTTDLILRGQNSYSAHVTDTALGTICSLESEVRGFEERAARLETDIKDSHKRAVELETKVDVPLEKEARYHQLVKRQAEIEEKLDLTKNQAPSQVEAAGGDENDEAISAKQSRPKSSRQNRQTVVSV